MNTLEEKNENVKKFEREREKLVRDNPGFMVAQIETIKSGDKVMTRVAWKNFVPILMPVVDQVMIETFMVIGGERVGEKMVYVIEQKTLMLMLKKISRLREKPVKYWLIGEVERERRKGIIEKCRYIGRER